jgi:enoyl-[acyl-carrier protein] reductase II
MEKDNVSLEEFEKLGSGSLRSAAVDGDVSWGSVMAGQCAAMVSSIQPAEEIIREMFQEADKVLEGLSGPENTEE